MKKPISILFILLITLLGGNYLQSADCDSPASGQARDHVAIQMDNLVLDDDAAVVDMDYHAPADNTGGIDNPLFLDGGDEEQEEQLTRWQKVKQRFGKFWATPQGKITITVSGTILAYLIVNWLSTYINNTTATPGQNENLVKEFISQVRPLLEATVKKEVEALKDLQSLSFSDAIRTVTTNVTGTIAPVLQQVQNNAVAIATNGADIASNGGDITQAVNQIAATRIELATHAAQVSAFIAGHP